MGEVYEARDKEHDARVALKALRFANPQGIYQFKREFRLLQNLAHPNLVQLGELFESDGRWFFTMELVEGESFISYVRGQDQPADDGQLRSCIGQLVRGLAALHGAGTIHRDIKPSNVLVTSAGRVVILDFGLSLDTHQEESNTQQVVGTAAYMSPEQAASKPVGPAADLYSVGTLLYEALTGRVPFDGMPLEVIVNKQIREPDAPSTLVAEVPADLDALCVDLLRFEPGVRPSSEQILRRLGDSVVATPPAVERPVEEDVFVGRDAELDALRDAFRDSHARASVAVFVRGESGMGKSELVRRFSAELAASGEATVLRGRCYERESVPYKAFDGIADSLSRELGRMPDADVTAYLPDDAALLGRLFPVLRRVEAIARQASSRDAHIDPQLLRSSMFGALRQLFRRMSERGPVVLVIDDIQWADSDSLTLLAELLRPPASPPLLLIATTRSENPEVFERFHAMVSPAGHDLRVLDVDRLSPATTRELVDTIAPEVDGHLRAAIAREADGHPLFVSELVRHARDPHRDGPATRLEDAIRARVARLPESARHLLELVCVAGLPTTHEVACHATRHDYPRHERAASTLRIAHLVRTSGPRETDTLEPYHDRIREAVLCRMDDPSRLHYHQRLIIALQRAGAPDPEALVRHLEAAGHTAEAAAQAAEAARRAASALAFDRAAELYRVVQRLSAPDDPTVARHLADALANAGRGVEAARAYRDAAAHSDPATRLECRRLAAEQLVRSGHLADGLAEYKELLTRQGIRLPESSGRALASLLWCRARLRLRGLGWKPRHPSELADKDLVRLDTFRAVGHSLGMVDNVRGAVFQARGLLESLRVGEPRRVLLAMSAEAIYIGSQGGRGLARARRLVREVDGFELDPGDNMARGWRAAANGIVGYMEGRFVEAAEILEGAVELFRGAAAGASWEYNTARMFRLFALKHAGRLNQVEQLYFGYLRDAEHRGDRYVETSTLRYGSFLWLARGRLDRAHANLERATWIPPEGRYHLQHWFELEARAELALYEGRASEILDQAEDELTAMRSSLLMRVQILRCLATSLYARLLLSRAADTESAQGLRTVRRLAHKLEREGVGFAKAWSALLLAGHARQRGNLDAAIAHLARASALGAEHDLRLVEAVADLERGRLTGDATVSERGRAQMRRERIADPARMARVLAPGLS